MGCSRVGYDAVLYLELELDILVELDREKRTVLNPDASSVSTF